MRRKGQRSTTAHVIDTKAVVKAGAEPQKRQRLSITEREQRFMQEYLKDYDAFKAMERAGYKDPRSAQARQIFARCADFMKKAQDEKSRQIGKHSFTSQERVLNQLTAQAHYNPKHFVVVQERPDPVDSRKKVLVHIQKPLHELTDQEAMCVKEVRYNPDGSVSGYTLHDQRGALVLIGKHMGMFNDKLIMEHRHRLLSKREDLTAVPDKVLEETEKALLKHMGPQAAKMIGEYMGEDP